MSAGGVGSDKSLIVWLWVQPTNAHMLSASLMFCTRFYSFTVSSEHPIQAYRIFWPCALRGNRKQMGMFQSWRSDLDLAVGWTISVVSPVHFYFDPCARQGNCVTRNQDSLSSVSPNRVTLTHMLTISYWQIAIMQHAYFGLQYSMYFLRHFPFSGRGGHICFWKLAVLFWRKGPIQT